MPLEISADRKSYHHNDHADCHRPVKLRLRTLRLRAVTAHTSYISQSAMTITCRRNCHLPVLRCPQFGLTVGPDVLAGISDSIAQRRPLRARRSFISAGSTMVIVFCASTSLFRGFDVVVGFEFVSIVENCDDAEYRVFER